MEGLVGHEGCLVLYSCLNGEPVTGTICDDLGVRVTILAVLLITLYSTAVQMPIPL